MSMKSDDCVLTISAKPLWVITRFVDPEELLNPHRSQLYPLGFMPSPLENEWLARQQQSLHRKRNLVSVKLSFPCSKHLVLLSNPTKAPNCCANFMNLGKSVRCQTRNCNQQKCWSFGFALDFSGVLLTGSALVPMVQMPKELALLGGSFLVGLGALEVCLRIGGFWHNNHLDNRSISNGQERKGLSFSAGTHQLPWPF